MNKIFEQNKGLQKLTRLTSLFLSVLLVFMLLVSLSATLLNVSAEETDTVGSTSTETSGETTAETTTEKDWSAETVTIKDKDGFLTVILKGVGTFLNWITMITGHNYIIALFIFAILVEVIMVPFGIKQHKNTIKQASLRPKETAIRKKYAGSNDRQTRAKMQQEIQALYTAENFNPLSGCLPLLIQLPIIMALYYIIVDPFKYVLGVSNEFAEMIKAYISANGVSLSSTRGSIELLTVIKEQGLTFFEGLKTFTVNGQECFDTLAEIIDKIPSFSVFGINTGYVVTAGSKWLYAVPVLTFAVYFASMKLNRKLTYQAPTTGDEKAQGCSNNMMDIVMPLFSVYITFIVPAAVGIYWIFKSITGVVKQFIMSKVMPYPTFTEEDYKAAEREILGKTPKKKKNASSGNNTQTSLSNGKRSLHHIDDDEYDENGKPLPRVNKEPYREDDEEEEFVSKSAIEAETLKDDFDLQETKETVETTESVNEQTDDNDESKDEQV